MDEGVNVYIHLVLRNSYTALLWSSLPRINLPGKQKVY